MIILILRTLLRDRAELAAENLVLRQQLAILEQRSKRSRLRKRDRIFWAWLSRSWSNWRSVLVIVQPDTVVRCHQQGFKLYWRWKSQGGKVGRPTIDAEIRKLIRRMSRENPSHAGQVNDLPPPLSANSKGRSSTCPTGLGPGHRRCLLSGQRDQFVAVGIRAGAAGAGLLEEAGAFLTARGIVAVLPVIDQAQGVGAVGGAAGVLAPMLRSQRAVKGRGAAGGLA